MTIGGDAELPSDARAYIPQLIREGYSANSALKFLREQGAGMRRETFLRTWGEVRGALAAQPALGSVPLDSPRPASELATWRAGRPDTFGYQVAVVVRDRPTGLVTTKTTYVFSPVNISPAEAQQRAIDNYVSVQTAGGPSGVVTAAYFVRGYQMLGRDAA